MLKKEHLFYLIKSLTKSEKRYFKVFAGRDGGAKNYLLLFDAIDNQESYNEAAIKEKFKKSGFVKQLHVAKNYLNKLLLQTLRNYNGRLSKETEVLEMLRNVEVLYEKELFPQCAFELRKVFEMAETYQLFPLLLSVLKWQRKLIQRSEPNNYTKLNEINVLHSKALSHIQRENELWQFGIDMASSFLATGKPVKLKLPSYAVEDLGLTARVSLSNSAYLIFLQKKKPLKAKEELVELANYLEKEEVLISQQPGLYISTVNNLISFLIFRKEMKEALIWVEKAKGFYFKWKKGKSLLKQILRTYNSELEICRFSEKTENFAKQIQHIELFILEKETKAPAEYLASFWFQFASLNFDKEDFKVALRWVNKFLNATDKNVRTDLQIQIRFLNLMIHLEQQNLFVLRYFTENTGRYIKKIRPLLAHEEVLLKFFSKVPKLPLAEQKGLFIKLQESLHEAQKIPLNPYSGGDSSIYKRWIATKI